MGLRDRIPATRLTPEAGAAFFIAGAGGLVTDATVASPTWAQGWGWIVLAIVSLCFGILGLYLIFRAPESPAERQARELERSRRTGRNLLEALTEPLGYEAFFDGGEPKELLRGIEDWRRNAPIPPRDREEWDRIWSSNVAGTPRSQARDDVAIHRRAEWQWRMRRAVDLIRRSLNETGPARDQPSREQVTARLAERWDQEGEPAPVAPTLNFTADELAAKRLERAGLWHLRDEARRHLAQYEALPLDRIAPAAADVWIDKWTSDVRRALVKDVPGLARFNEPIDAVSGQDARLRPVTMLRHRLARLDEIAADEYFEGPTVVAEVMTEQEIRDAQPTVASVKSPHSVLAGQPAPVHPREPTEEEVADRAAILYAQVQDLTPGNVYFGRNMARELARQELRRELRGEPDPDKESEP